MSDKRTSGTIRANPARGHLNHVRAGIHFDRDIPREFVVDTKARAIVDKQGEPLVIPEAIYADLVKANGGALVIEHRSAPDPAQASRIEQLEREIAELRAAGVSEATRIGREMAQLERERNEARDRVATLERHAFDVDAARAGALERIADLEMRLADMDKQLADAHRPRAGRAGSKPE
jgi:septal ring factor EnvC (AmiA/AmiB activator)